MPLILLQTTLINLRVAATKVRLENKICSPIKFRIAAMAFFFISLAFEETITRSELHFSDRNPKTKVGSFEIITLSKDFPEAMSDELCKYILHLKFVYTMRLGTAHSICSGI